MWFSKISRTAAIKYEVWTIFQDDRTSLEYFCSKCPTSQVSPCLNTEYPFLLIASSSRLFLGLITAQRRCTSTSQIDLDINHRQGKAGGWVWAANWNGRYGKNNLNLSYTKPLLGCFCYQLCQSLSNWYGVDLAGFSVRRMRTQRLPSCLQSKKIQHQMGAYRKQKCLPRKAMLLLVNWFSF